MFNNNNKQMKELLLTTNVSQSLQISHHKTKNKKSNHPKRSNSFLNKPHKQSKQPFAKLLNHHKKSISHSKSNHNNNLSASKLQCEDHIHTYKNSQLISKLHIKFKKSLDQLKIPHQNATIKLNQFFQLFYKMKKQIIQQELIPTEQLLLSIWKAFGGFENHIISINFIFLLILYIQNLLQFYPEDQDKQKLIQIMEQVQKKFKLKSCNLLPQKTGRSLPSEQAKPDKKNKGFKYKSPLLEVMLKIGQGIYERLKIYNNTCIDIQLRNLGIKYSNQVYNIELSSEKLKAIRSMINSQLKKELTKITQESLDNLSDISVLFNEMK